MSGRPKKKRMKDKDEPKKYGKLSKKAVKMTCSLCKQVGHNKTACGRRHGMGGPSQPIPSTERQRSQSQPTPLTQSSFVCSDTSSVPRDAQTVAPTPAGPAYPTANSAYATTQSSSICGDTRAVPVAPQKRAQVGAGRGTGRKKFTNARGVPFVSAREDYSSSQLPPLSGHKRAYTTDGFAAATGNKSRPTTGFGVYFNPVTGAQVFNSGTTSERVLHGATNLKSASPTNIDIGYKARGLKCQGKNAMTTSQLSRMRANKRNQKAASVTSRSSVEGSSNK